MPIRPHDGARAPLLLALTGLFMLGACRDAPPGPAPQAGVASAEAARAAEREDQALVSREVASAQALLEAGDPAGAVERARALLLNHPQAVEARVLLAAAELVQGRTRQALVEADRAVALDPRSVGALVTRGAALHGLGRTDEAVIATRAALALDGANRAALTNLAAFLVAQEDHAGAAGIFRQLVALDGSDVGARARLARSLAASGDLEGAVEAADEVVRRDPARGEVRLLLAAALLDLDRPREAMDHAQAAATLDGGSEEAVALFRASFYVAVASTLICADGPAPWSDEAVERALEPFRRAGLEGVDAFRTMDRELGKDEAVRERLARVAARCKPPKAGP